MHTLPLRLQRLRHTKAARALLQEHRLTPQTFIAPLFISETHTRKQPIASMPGQFQWSLNDVLTEIDVLSELDIPAVLLFGIPADKDAKGSSALKSNGIIQEATAAIKRHNPEMLVITDVCFCEYTSHGHCGVLQGDAIDSQRTAALLGQQAVTHARAGADWVAPSSMTDGMVQAIRTALDDAGFQHTAILAYSVKYCSSLYGPFREAACGAPQFGDRQGYQMNPANSAEALREAALDIDEGADLIMVKPAGNYLDIIYKLKHHYPAVPLCAYQVSGEYSMLKHAASCGLLNEEQAMIESLMAIKRAGADMIITYFAKDIARLLRGRG